MNKSIKLLAALTLFSTASIAQDNDSIPTEISRGIEYGRNISFDLKESTTATAVTTADVLSNRTSINPSNNLYGLIPGLQVLQNANNAWNDGASLLVRGYNTLNNNAPLVLVDGFERSINLLTVQEIESVTVLKDAAATALYGLRGGNGVILVKTKRGKMGKPEINVSYNFNMGTPNRLPEFVNAYTYAQGLNEAMKYDGLSPRYSTDELNAFKNQTHPGAYPDVDWWNEALRDHSFGDNVNFSASGGNKFIRYFTQLNFLDDRGILKPTSDNEGYSTQFKYSKLNVRTNLDITFGPSTEVKINLMGNFSEHNRPGRTADQIFTALYQVPAAAFPVKTSREIWGGTSVYGNNPVALISGTGYARAQGRTLLADFELTQKLDFITQGLTFGARIGIDNYGSYWDSNTMKFGYESVTADLVTGEETFSTLDAEGPLTFSSSTGQFTNHFNFETRLNYDYGKDKHKLNATLLYSMDKTIEAGRSASTAFIDVVGQLHYVYNNRYIVDLSLTGSGASVLEPGNRWGIFPAIGAGWLLSEEDFLKKDWLDLLKFRASYGISGRADFPINIWRDQYNSSGTYWFGNNLTSQTGRRETLLGTKGLTYEKSHKLNVGFDLNTWKKFSLTMDGFYDHRTDILINGSATYSSILGLSVPAINAGVVNNYGVEIATAWNDRIGNVTYQLGGQFSFVRNKIKEQNEQYRPYDYLKRTGHSIGQIFGYEVVGIYKDQAEIDNRPVKQYLSEVGPGDLMFKDQNGDNRIDNYDMVPLGHNTYCPEIYYSFNLGAEYKGFGFYALFQGTGNYSRILNTTSVYRPLMNNSTISTHYYENRWTESNPNALYPRLTSTGSDNNYNTNSLWVADASFLKLRTIELYYDIDSERFKNLKFLNRARIFVRAHDLITWDKIKIADPESIGATHPTMTQCTFGVNLTF